MTRIAVLNSGESKEQVLMYWFTQLWVYKFASRVFFFALEIEMRCGFLGRAGDMLQFPPGAPPGLGLDALSGVKFPTPPQSMSAGLGKW